MHQVINYIINKQDNLWITFLFLKLCILINIIINKNWPGVVHLHGASCVNDYNVLSVVLYQLLLNMFNEIIEAVVEVGVIKFFLNFYNEWTHIHSSGMAIICLSCCCRCCRTFISGLKDNRGFIHI